MLEGRRILIAVSGGIAAYKTAYLVRRLREEGAEVRVAMTQAAGEFVGAQTFAALTEHPVAETLFGAVSPHTELAAWADGIVVAPATATLLAKAANGIGDDLVTATLLAARSPILFAPAMHTEMWEHPATRRNVATLLADGRRMVGPDSGALAGDDRGIGRMAEPEEIVVALDAMLNPSLAGRRVVVTAGGTREPIDPVRYIGNRSTGKMGYAIAEEAARRDAAVTLISASALPVPPRVDLVPVETAQQMLEAVTRTSSDADVLVMAAAVADFRPAVLAEEKIRRSDGVPQIELTANPDILASVTSQDRRPFVVGFAAETGSLDRAVDKAKKKGVDVMVANDVTAPGSGFGTDTNQVTVIHDGQIDRWPMLSKRDVAHRLWDLIESQLEP